MSFNHNKFLSSVTTSADNTVTLSNDVDLDAFMVTTINSLQDLKTNTQYITAIPNETIIDSHVNADDIKCNNIFNNSGSTMIDLSDDGDINISATNLTFNNDNIATQTDVDTLKDRLTIVENTSASVDLKVLQNKTTVLENKTRLLTGLTDTSTMFKGTLIFSETYITTWKSAVITPTYNDLLSDIYVIGFSFIPSVDINIMDISIPTKGWMSTGDKEIRLYLMDKLIYSNVTQKNGTTSGVIGNINIELYAGQTYTLLTTKQPNDYVDNSNVQSFSSEITNVKTVVEYEQYELQNYPPNHVISTSRASYLNFQYIIRNGHINGLDRLNGMFVSGRLASSYTPGSLASFNNNNIGILGMGHYGILVLPSLNLGDTYKLHVSGILNSSSTQTLSLSSTVNTPFSTNMLLGLCTNRPFEYELTYIVQLYDNYVYSKFAYTNNSGVYVSHLFNITNMTVIPNLMLMATFGNNTTGSIICNSMILTKM